MLKQLTAMIENRLLVQVNVATVCVCLFKLLSKREREKKEIAAFLSVQSIELKVDVMVVKWKNQQTTCLPSFKYLINQHHQHENISLENRISILSNRICVCGDTSVMANIQIYCYYQSIENVSCLCNISEFWI